MGNTYNNNNGANYWKALVETTTTGGTIDLIDVSHNTGFGVIATYLGLKPGVLRDNVRRTLAGATLYTTNQGASTFSGAAGVLTFTIPHGIDGTPSHVNVTPGSAAAAGSFHATADATNITVTYVAAPAAGANNVKLNWSAQL